MRNEINGYLEFDGQIFRINSLDDVNNFVLRFGNLVHELTEKEIDELTLKDGDMDFDDCGVGYLKNSQILKDGPHRWHDVESYKIREGTIAISNKAFECGGNNQRKSLTSIKFANTVIAIGAYAFSQNALLSTIKLSGSLLKIGRCSFLSCSKLSNIVLPQSLKFIDQLAFSQSGLITITLPDSICTIGAQAFKSCENLTEVTFCGIPKMISSGIFDRCINLKTVFVPEGSKEFFVHELFPINPDYIFEKEM